MRVLSRCPEKTLPSPTATPRLVPPKRGLVLPLHRAGRGVDREDIAGDPDAMNITPSTTTGVACIVPGRLAVLEMDQPRAAELRDIRSVDFA